MARLSTVAIAMGLAASAAAQSQSDVPTTFASGSSTPTASGASGPVVTIPVPGGVDNGAVVGSLLGTASSMTTIVLSCPSGTPSEDCGYNPPITVTFGASTLLAHATAPGQDGYTVQENCVLSTNDAASCVYTFVGQASAVAESNSATNPATLTGITTSMQTQTYTAGEVQRVPITLAAGQTAASSDTATSGGPKTLSTSGTTSTFVSGTRSRSSATGASASASSTNTSNEARVLVPGAFAAGLVGLVAMLL